MRLRYTQPALADLDAILTYIAQHSPQGAERVQDRLRQRIELPLSHPEIGARTEDAAIRRLVAAPFPYLIFDELAEGDIVTHAVRHPLVTHPACRAGAERP